MSQGDREVKALVHKGFICWKHGDDPQKQYLVLRGIFSELKALGFEAQLCEAKRAFIATRVTSPAITCIPIENCASQPSGRHGQRASAA